MAVRWPEVHISSQLSKSQPAILPLTEKITCSNWEVSKTWQNDHLKRQKFSEIWKVSSETYEEPTKEGRFKPFGAKTQIWNKKGSTSLI